MINKDQIENIKSMLKSDNIDDINLAGNLIKTHVLGITDEQLENFEELIRVFQGFPSMYEVLALLKSNSANYMQYEHFMESQTGIIVRSLSKCGELTLKPE